MDLLLCWLVAPAGLLLTAIGLSLLLERLAELSLPWAARPALGLAIAIVLAQAGTQTATTAKLTLPTILVLAALGLLLGGRVPDRRPGRAELGVGGLVFVLFAAPFLLGGGATWAGYIKLDDTATWLALTSHVFEHGRGLGDLPPSTHAQVIADTLGVGYPIGAFAPIALMSSVSGQDIAFTLQPSMAFAAAAMALLLFDLSQRLVRGVRPAAAVAVLASLSSILLATYLWGGVKELVVAALLPLGPVLAGWAAREGWPRHLWAPIAVNIAAMIAVFGPAGGLWAVSPLLPALVALIWTHGPLRAAIVAIPVGVASFLLVLPVLFTPTQAFDPLTEGITQSSDLGNLTAPLNPVQTAGIWPALDFRSDPHLMPAALALAIACLAIALVVLLLAARLGAGRGLPLVGYVGGGALAALATARYGSPWVDAKAMAMVSPGVLAAALLGIAMLGQRTPFRFEAMALGGVVAAAVAGSAFLAYQGAWLAPRDRYVELERIGERFAGEGPALSTEASVYGPRHFLRHLEAEGASDRRWRPVELVGGEPPDPGQPVDLDDIAPGQLDPYDLIVTRRLPTISRPTATFGLAHAGKHYLVWRREQPPGQLLERLPLGDALDAGAAVGCAAVRRLAAAAGDEGELVAARIGEPTAVELGSAQLPPGWESASLGSVVPDGSGSLSARVTVPHGEYELWLGGAAFGQLDVDVDGRRVASVQRMVNHAGGMEPVGSITLTQGVHRFELDYRGRSLAPGTGPVPHRIGPLVLGDAVGDPGLVTVPAADHRRLCGRRWDWVEAYG